MQNNTRYFTAEEVEDLVFEGKRLHEEILGQNRWSLYMLSIVEVDGVPYAIEWNRGATEMQENEFIAQTSVAMEEREVTIKKWLPKNKEEE